MKLPHASRPTAFNARSCPTRTPSTHRILPILLIFWTAVFLLLMVFSSTRSAQPMYEPDDAVAFERRAHLHGL